MVFAGRRLSLSDFAEHAVQSVNTLVEKARVLTPGKKTLISPYGIVNSAFDDPAYERQLAKLKVDIIAYQDEIGCVREQFPLLRLKRSWEKLRAIHDRLGIALWANCETFTWENETNDRASALIPSAYSRLLSQQVAASVAGVETITSFMMYGLFDKPDSPFNWGSQFGRIRHIQIIWLGRTVISIGTIWLLLLQVR